MVQVGARWWKFDFHTHTPASMDYGRNEPRLRDTVTPREWLNSFFEQGIECVAVTDHNTGSWIKSLQAEALAMRSEGKIIHIFPGVEITANGNVHILAIFDPSKTADDVHAIVGAAKFRGAYGNSDAVAEESAENIVDEIIKSGGVAVPAHIDMKAGLCQLQSSHTIHQTLRKSSAIEVIFPEGGRGPDHDECLRRYSSLELKLAEVIGSDSHRPDEVGRAFTWVKMSSPTIDGLKLALIDGPSSIKRSHTTTKNPNAVSNNIICSISIEKAKYCGRGKPLEIKFNPWLNSVIGGRGSGKSSMLEFIRLVLGRDRDLLEITGHNEVKETFSRFAQTSSSRDSYGALLQETTIACIIQKDGAYYHLKWVNDKSGIKISKWDGEKWNSEHGNARDRFPIKIFSQKQIYDIARNPSALIKLIDETDVVDLPNWKMEWDQKENNFLSISNKKRILESQISNKQILEGQLSDTLQKIGLIESSGHDQILNSFNSAASKNQAINAFKFKLSEVGGSISSELNKHQELSFDANAFSPAAQGDVEVLERIENMRHAYTEFKNTVSFLLSGLNSKINELDQWLAESAFSKQQELSTQNYNNLVASFSQSGLNSPDQYKSLIETKTNILNKLNEIRGHERNLHQTNIDLNLSYADLINHRKSLTNRRRNFLKQHLSENKSIDLYIEPLCNIEQLEASFRSLINRNDGSFASELIDKDKGTGFLHKLWTQLLQEKSTQPQNTDDLAQHFTHIHNFKSEVFNYNSGKIMGTTIGKRFFELMQNLQPQIYDRINLWFPEDQLVVKFDDGKRLKDISQGSAGQKAAAVLSFLLSYGTEPLILDQPEDDLDNGLISSLIVSKLQENKGRRQIIVITHNPNIVVNGDSEFVVALQDKGSIEVLASGALQDLSVRREVCEIMEGGKQALEQRYRRMLTI